MRGLKHTNANTIAHLKKVAPHAGAWIETKKAAGVLGAFTVAPHAGAWIETKRYWMQIRNRWVAPHAGAWIETNVSWCFSCIAASHPTRVRGLKLPGLVTGLPHYRRTPRGCVD